MANLSTGLLLLATALLATTPSLNAAAAPELDVAALARELQAVRAAQEVQADTLDRIRTAHAADLAALNGIVAEQQHQIDGLLDTLSDVLQLVDDQEREDDAGGAGGSGTLMASRGPARRMSARARALATTNFTKYGGLNIKRDLAQVSFGADSDVRIVRSDDGTLELVVDNLYVHGALHAETLFVDEQNIEELCTSNTANVTVEAITADVTSSDSTDSVYVSFYFPSVGWSSEFDFFTGTSAGGIHTATFELFDIPSKVRLSLSGDDAWGIEQVSVQINDDEEEIVLCSGVIGTVPAMGNNGHWIDGDGDGGAPATVTYDIRNACNSEVEVTVETGHVTSSDTTNTVYVSFYLGETEGWTDVLPLFTGGSAKGDVESELYGMYSQPSQIAFTISSTNAWGFDYLVVDVDGYTFVMSCDGTQSGMSSTSMHWVDGDGSSGVVKRLVLNITHTECDSL